jgi:hypothetical protein
MSTAEEAEAPQSRIAETAPPDATGGLDPLPPKPQRDGSALDLQAIRLAAVTATAITEHRHVTREDWPVFDEALSHLFALLGEVERLSREVTTREAAARHALDAASQARQEANRLRTDLAEAEDDRAAAYLVEVRCWDLLSRALGYLPDKILADPEQPGLDYDLGQLRPTSASSLRPNRPPPPGRCGSGCAPPRQSPRWRGPCLNCSVRAASAPRRSTGSRRACSPPWPHMIRH